MKNAMAILGIFSSLAGTANAEAQTSSTQKTVLITGAASGIGRATAIAFAGKGYITYATDKDTINLKELENFGCRTKYLDVTIEEAMYTAVREIEQETGGIDILVNNAGFGQNGFIEELSINQIRRQFEVNVFGLVRMTQLVLPNMRQRKSGRIINVGSVGGEFTTPGASAYHASKWALESLNDGMRSELRQFGIEVVLIKPGGVYTNFMNTANKLYPEPMADGTYNEFREKFLTQSNAIFDPNNRTYGVLTPERVADVIVKSAERKRPKTRYKIGALAKITPVIHSVLSDRAFDKFMLRQLKVTTKKGESNYHRK
jgi:short-subunit dehydrogenase